MSMSLEDSGGFNPSRQEREPHWDAGIQWFEFPPDAQSHAYRLVAKGFQYAQHWIQVHKRDGTKGKPFPAVCRNFDSVTAKYAANGCPVCELTFDVRAAYKGKKFDDWDEDLKRMLPRITLAHNAIIRDMQAEGRPINKGDWSFVQPCRITQGVSDELLEKAKKINTIKGVTYDLNHAQYGRDFLMSYNPESTDKRKIYTIDNVEGHSPLTEEERAHAKYLVDFSKFLKYPDPKDIKEALDRFGYYGRVERMLAVGAVKSVPQASAAKAAAPAAQVSAPSAFDVDATIEASEGKSEGLKAQVGTLPQQPVEDDVDMLPPKAAAPAPKTQPAPVAEKKPEPTPPAPAPAAKASGTGMEATVISFAEANKFPVIKGEKTYEGVEELRYYRPGLSIPDCFSDYQKHPGICKKCPIKVDCMMTNG